MSINLNPSNKELKQIEKWLIEEMDSSNEGFYGNWRIIKESFSKQELITFDYNEFPIGFLVWSQRDLSIEIDIFEIKPSHRKKGIGKKLFYEISDYFRSNEALALTLSSYSEESNGFWENVNFLKYSNRGFLESESSRYFKFLVDVSKPQQYYYGENKLELWDVEPFEARTKQPKWVWALPENPINLSKPIIHLCDCNWNIRWVQNRITIQEGKVKYFGKNGNKVDYSPFLYVDSLRY